MADVLPAKASCRSWCASRKVLLYATHLGVSEQGATPSFFTERSTCNWQRYAAALATGNSALACEDQTKACVYREATVRSEACRIGTAYEVCLRNPRIIAQSY